jgi:spore coat polysaccharide biosynthesis protein SpsF|nr:glycosyltransferase family protein [Kofleriaceae bacterium]
MTTVAILQARLGSSRLPGKVLHDLGGDTMLARVIERLTAARTLDGVVVATTTAASDDAIAREATRCGAGVFRGSEHDVLARYLGAARVANADVVVRVTSDCPLLDPQVVDQVVEALGLDVDYASNTHVRSYPRGLDVEALHRDTLERIGRLGRSPAAREHVTAYIMEAPERFAVRQVRAARDDSDLRWTVDTADDLALVRAIYARFGLAESIVPYAQLVDAVRAEPELGVINAHVSQKSWQQTEQVSRGA